MHLYNAWLPPPVAAQTTAEKDSFARIIAAVKSSFRHDDPDSVFSTLKYISVLDLFIKAKSEVSLEDVHSIIQTGLDLFHMARNKLYAHKYSGHKTHINPAETSIPDSATLKDQWKYAIRQYSKWYSHAWGTAILAGTAFFALGWVIKGENPIPSFRSTETEPSSDKDKPTQP